MPFDIALGALFSAAAVIEVFGLAAALMVRYNRSAHSALPHLSGYDVFLQQPGPNSNASTSCACTRSEPSRLPSWCSLPR